MNKVQILVTGERFTGSGFRSIENVMREIIKSAKNEIHIGTFLFTWEELAELLISAASRGVHVFIILDRLDSQPASIIKKLKEAAKIFPHFILKEFSKNQNDMFHAKAIIGDRKSAIVGSANFSRAGMSGNHEIAVMVTGKEAERIAVLLEKL